MRTTAPGKPCGAGAPSERHVHHASVVISATARAALLHRRARRRPERTEHAAMPCVGPQARTTACALVKECAGVRWHEQLFRVPAVRTAKRRVKRRHATETNAIYARMCCRRRATTPNPASPTAMSAHVPGSGTAVSASPSSVVDTPSSFTTVAAPLFRSTE